MSLGQLSGMLHRLPLRTTSLLIRPFTLDDSAGMLALSHEETLRTWLPSQVYRDEAEARSVLEFLISQYGSPGDPRRGPIVLALDHRDDGALIGHVGFSALGDDVEIGYAIGQRYQRRGFASEAIEAASRWALDVFGLGRILGIPAVANIASRRSLERAGYVQEPDRFMKYQGVEQTVSVYALERGPGDP